MSKIIWKFKVGAKVKMPICSEILKLEVQGNFPVIWALFHSDSKDNLEDRFFQRFGTGQEIPLSSRYIGTYFEDQFVWHIFETREPSEQGK